MFCRWTKVVELEMMLFWNKLTKTSIIILFFCLWHSLLSRPIIPYLDVLDCPLNNVVYKPLITLNVVLKTFLLFKEVATEDNAGSRWVSHWYDWLHSQPRHLKPVLVTASTVSVHKSCPYKALFKRFEYAFHISMDFAFVQNKISQIINNIYLCSFNIQSCILM